MTNQVATFAIPGRNQALQHERENRVERATVAAIIVLYHPNPSLLTRLIDSITPGVEKLFVVDNTPGANSNPPAPFIHCAIPVFYQTLGINKGLAAAQNIGIRRAIEENCSHILLLDQDSALPAAAIDRLLSAERSLLWAGKSVAAVGPLFIDEKAGKRCCAIRHSWVRVRWAPIPESEADPVETDYLIASGR